jgi:hypothetical protein
MSPAVAAVDPSAQARGAAAGSPDSNGGGALAPRRQVSCPRPSPEFWKAFDSQTKGVHDDVVQRIDGLVQRLGVLTVRLQGPRVTAAGERANGDGAGGEQTGDRRSREAGH